ncbi:MAG: glycosyltransferase [Pseudolabrys sp.]|nr:glycosyltransferase [Pseudolabrys sp.]
MKIGIFVSEFPALSETFILNQITGLIRRGHTIEISAVKRGDTSKMHDDVASYRLLDCTHYDDVPRSWLRRTGGAARRVAQWGHRNVAATADSLNVVRHGKAALNLSVLYQRLPAARRTQRYDVIHCHYGPNALRALGQRGFGALNGPIVTSFHGYDLNAFPEVHGLDVYDELFRSGTLFTVGSEFMRESLVAIGAPAARIVKLPAGVDLQFFQFSERCSPKDGPLRLLSVARLVEVKGIRYALQAVALLAQRFPRLRYVVAGGGPLRAELEAYALDLGIVDNVHFAGAVTQDEVRALYQEAHIFLLPSIATGAGEEEGQALVLAEAQAAGLPVVASAVGGIAESIDPGISGFLVPQRDADATAAAVTQLVERSEQWGAIGRAGRHVAASRFDNMKLNQRLIEIYQQAITSPVLQQRQS